MVLSAIVIVNGTIGLMNSEFSYIYNHGHGESCESIKWLQFSSLNTWF
jgi:hypothetical protein